MDNFVVSARKYRPLGFEEVVGQDHITTTLKNAIDNKKLAQALLFCGPRGVGKTTCARIVARMINGFEEKAEMNSLNIFELDAASNNSVEDIRNLIDQVRYPPQFGKFKVYIIDEVHMLSSAAFNAFLKTLEEPPPYAIFILATTEKHKVIPTILSRCQIFDFNRIQVSDIARQLKKIADREGIKAEEAALHLIAQKADGALRDGLSIFDLMVTFASGNEVTFKSVIENLHILDYDYYFRVVDGLLAENATVPMLLLDEVLRKGFDGQNFIVGLAEHLRNLLVAQDARTVQLMEVPESTKKKYLEQAQAGPPSLLLSWLNIANLCDINYKTSKNQRLTVELALMKMAHVNAVLKSGSVNGAVPAEAALKKKTELTEPAAAPKPEVIPIGPVIVTKPGPAPASPEVNPVGPVILPQGVPVSQAGSKPETSSTPKSDRPKSTFSLNSIGKVTKTTEEKPTKKADEVVEAREIDFATLTRVWEEFAEQRKGQVAEYQLLKGNIRLDNNHVVLTLNNPIQEPLLQGIRTSLVGFLREKLGNGSVNVSGVLEQAAPSRVIYTNKEKFEHLAEQFPTLKDLKERFGLDTDF